MKEVTITVKLLLEDDQPCCDWVYESIEQQLDKSKGEEILSYSDSELIEHYLNTVPVDQVSTTS